MIDYSLSEKLKCGYKNAYPFPYIVIDNFLPTFILDRCLEELQEHDYWYENNQEWINKFERNKFYTPNHDTNIPELKKQIPITSMIIDYLNGNEFLGFLRDLTGHESLHGDDMLMGGGIHKILNGGKLSVHTDYNTHPQTKHHRKLNLLLYLNKDWKDEYNGNLELWDKNVENCIVSVKPIFNRVVIFDIEDAPHGHPIPLNVPEKVARYSLALYYFIDDMAERQKTVMFVEDEWVFKTENLKR